MMPQPVSITETVKVQISREVWEKCRTANTIQNGERAKAGIEKVPLYVDMSEMLSLGLDRFNIQNSTNSENSTKGRIDTADYAGLNDEAAGE